MGFRSKGRYYWNDPDDRKCSGFVIFQKMEGDMAVVKHEDTKDASNGVDFQVMPHELMTEKRANAPRYVIAGKTVRHTETGEPMFWNNEIGFVTMDQADLLSQVMRDRIGEGDGKAILPNGCAIIRLPEVLVEKP